MRLGIPDKRTSLIVFALALTAWVAHFFWVRDFLLFEDDYSHVGRSLNGEWDEIYYLLKWAWEAWPQGRPLHFSLMPVLTGLGMHMGGLPWVYFFGFLFIAGNAALFYFIALKMAPPGPALAGACAFCLFPADTTHAMLTHNMALQASLMFLLAAVYSYLSGKKRISYLLIAGTLICYETAIVPFVAAPLLKMPWNRKTLKELATTAAVVALLMTGHALLRASMHEHRMLELVSNSPWLLAGHVPASMVIGPLTVLKAFILRPGYALSHANAFMAASGLIFAGGLGWALWRLPLPLELKSLSFSALSEKHGLKMQGSLKIPRGLAPGGRLVIAGALALCLAYVLTFTRWPPTSLGGRDTCVHLAATFGASIVITGLVWMILETAGMFRLKLAAAAAVAVYLALLLGFSLAVQKDFVNGSEFQRKFWGEVLQLCPDLEDGTTIFVKENIRTTSDFVIPNAWSVRLVLEQMFQFPKDWTSPPSLFILNEKIIAGIAPDPGGESWTLLIPGEGRETRAVKQGEVIALELNADGLVRLKSAEHRPGWEALEGLQVKPEGKASIQSLEKKALYRIMTERGLR